MNAILIGKVVDTADPLEKGRVKIFVDGRFEPSTDWIMPAATTGSATTRSGNVTPKVDSYVLVFFANDDPSNGYFLPVNNDGFSVDGESEWVFGNVKINLKENSVVKISDGASSVEMQATTGIIRVVSPNIVRVEATEIELVAPSIKLNQRLVLPGSDPI